MKRYLVFFFLCLIPFSSWGQTYSPKPEEVVTLIISSNISGEIEPCG